MDHHEINNEEIIEKYLLGKLSPEKSTEFEDHLFFCKECMMELDEHQKLIDAVRGAAEQEVLSGRDATAQLPGRRKMNKIFSLYIPLAVAASVLLAAVILVPSYLARNTENKTAGTFAAYQKSSGDRRVIVPGNLFENNNNNAPFFAENKQIEDSMMYEERREQEILAMINRGIIPEVSCLADIKPADNTTFRAGEKIIFSWRSKFVNTGFQLTVFNNKNREVYSKMVYKRLSKAADTLRTTSMAPGLYYWQVEPQNKKECPHTGKFRLIKK